MKFFHRGKMWSAISQYSNL